MSERRTLGQLVTAVEKEVAVAREDADAARTLASGADRDVSNMNDKLIAHQSALNALRETQLDQGKAMKKGFAEMRAETRTGFAVLKGGQEQITKLLTAHLPKSDEPE